MGPPLDDGASGNHKGLVRRLWFFVPTLGLGSTAETCVCVRVCVIARLRAVHAEQFHTPPMYVPFPWTRTMKVML